MKTKILLSILTMILFASVSGQNIELSFNGIDNTNYTQLDSIKIINRTSGSDTILYYPDTVLILYLVGTNEIFSEDLSFNIKQNYPNPVFNNTTIDFFIPEKGEVKMTISDLMGRQLINKTMMLEKGSHKFSFTTGDAKIYFFTAIHNFTKQSIKIISAAQETNRQCSLEHIGSPSVKQPTKNASSADAFSFTFGDLLLYAVYFDTIESGLQDSPETSQDYTFQFATNIPCPGTPTVDYGGQIYNTIQVYGQCWMKENLNVGTMLYVPEMPTNNGTIEKYCLGDMETYCSVYGGLYFWNEIMNYTFVTGGQGICPEGWHIPDDIDWQILEGAVDSEFKIGDTEWQNNDWRGMDVGGNLKQTGTQHWTPPNTGATDAYGFSTLPSGYYVQNEFWGVWYKSYHWSSDINNKYYRNIDWNQTKIKRDNSGGTGNQLAFSVRCVKDN